MFLIVIIQLIYGSLDLIFNSIKNLAVAVFYFRASMDKVLEVQRDIRQNAGEVQDFLKVRFSVLISMFALGNINICTGTIGT